MDAQALCDRGSGRQENALGVAVRGTRVITELNPIDKRPIQDTPCARCGHGNAHGLGECKEWMGCWTLERATFGHCGCPEWVQPELCSCGAPISGARSRRAKTYLNGVRACSLECALR